MSLTPSGSAWRRRYVRRNCRCQSGNVGNLNLAISTPGISCRKSFSYIFSLYL
ncbi:hypothetical protein KSP39_PZI020992 [Platanthera zijinensis]|uniref:Uncharacterized protein n=1 Tax=Platanthera zijinensis TaxID=2320716 RepID=A0AAP0FVX1_9ASPA